MAVMSVLLQSEFDKVMLYKCV